MLIQYSKLIRQIEALLLGLIFKRKNTCNMRFKKEFNTLNIDTVSELLDNNESNQSFAIAMASQQIYNADAFTLDDIEDKFSEVY